jgi:hypothetical protein
VLGEPENGLVGGIAIDFTFRKREMTASSIKLTRIAKTSDDMELVDSILAALCGTLANHFILGSLRGHVEQSNSGFSDVHFIQYRLA